MRLEERIDALIKLGKLISKDNEKLVAAVEYAEYKNKWFTKENSWNALFAIRDEFLNEGKLVRWTSGYTIKEDAARKTVGLILAGNIPLVGFHDILCVYISGQRAMIKYSDKDQVLTNYLLNALQMQNPELKNSFEVVDRLEKFDAVIATGSNNSARYFDYYFGKYPNVIRKNRNALAVLTGEESDDELRLLGNDIFNYFGLGCRNVSKVYLPKGYDRDKLLEILHERNRIILHSKYKNNYDYNIALFMLNREEYLNNGSIILKESKDIPSRIACLHYEYYDDQEKLNEELITMKNEIQCVATKLDLKNLPLVGLGQTQCPTISDYADGVDTLSFLTSL